MSTLVTILRPTVQLGMNSWLDFGELESSSSITSSRGFPIGANNFPGRLKKRVAPCPLSETALLGRQRTWS
jgi:hypothetical protein